MLTIPSIPWFAELETPLHDNPHPLRRHHRLSSYGRRHRATRSEVPTAGRSGALAVSQGDTTVRHDYLAVHSSGSRCVLQPGLELDRSGCEKDAALVRVEQAWRGVGGGLFTVGLSVRFCGFCAV